MCSEGEYNWTVVLQIESFMDGIKIVEKGVVLVRVTSRSCSYRLGDRDWSKAVVHMSIRYLEVFWFWLCCGRLLFCEWGLAEIF